MIMSRILSGIVFDKVGYPKKQLQRRLQVSLQAANALGDPLLSARVPLLRAPVAKLGQGPWLGIPAKAESAPKPYLCPE